MKRTGKYDSTATRDGYRPRLFIASTNPGKLAEFRQLLPPNFELVTPSEIPITFPPETGETFAENARAKAVTAATFSGMMALGDDSGLEVDALGGKPGVRSARYAGEPPSDERNVAKLLDAMTDVPGEQRGARFRCVVALASPGDTVTLEEGVCEGMIAFAPRGHNGFGYDPVFVLAGGRTMAQLAAAEKNQISHRAQAYRRILPGLLTAFGHDQSEEG